jgi:hypothetical protein
VPDQYLQNEKLKEESLNLRKDLENAKKVAEKAK